MIRGPGPSTESPSGSSQIFLPPTFSSEFPLDNCFRIRSPSRSKIYDRAMLFHCKWLIPTYIEVEVILPSASKWDHQLLLFRKEFFTTCVPLQQGDGQNIGTFRCWINSFWFALNGKTLKGTACKLSRKFFEVSQMSLKFWTLLFFAMSTTFFIRLTKGFLLLARLYHVFCLTGFGFLKYLSYSTALSHLLLVFFFSLFAVIPLASCRSFVIRRWRMRLCPCTWDNIFVVETFGYLHWGAFPARHIWLRDICASLSYVAGPLRLRAFASGSCVYVKVVASWSFFVAS